MYNLEAILTSNIFGAMIITIVLISSEKARKSSLPDEKLFNALAISVLVLCVTEAFSFVVDKAQFPGAIIFIRISNSLLYMLDLLPSALWLAYVDYKVYESREHLIKSTKLLMIPVVVMFILGFCNIFVDIFFTILPDNTYSRLPLFFLPTCMAVMYLVVSVVLLLANRNKMRKYIFLPMMSFIIIPVLGTIIQSMFYGLSLMWSSTALSIVMLYLNVQKEIVSTDALTGLYSRMRLDNYLKGECSKHRSENSRLIGLMLDVDRFKSINDSYGHATGDDALESVGFILREACGNDAFLARYAGDEFIIIIKYDGNDTNAVTDKMITGIRRRTESFNRTSGKPYNLSFSIGTAVYGSVDDDSVDKFLHRMDDAMYDDKASSRLTAKNQKN